jgi:hypothetical protein
VGYAHHQPDDQRSSNGLRLSGEQLRNRHHYFHRFDPTCYLSTYCILVEINPKDAGAAGHQKVERYAEKVQRQ